MNMKSFLYSLWEIFEVVLVAVIAVLFVRHFLIQPFLVSGASMEPNFSSGDYLLIDELTYRFRDPQRGEVAVFHYPGDKSAYYIKRIIGLPGERLVLKNGSIMIFNNEYPQGFVVNENYLPPELKTSGDKEIILKNDECFVLGDNRNYSFDSRNWGNLLKTEIIGIVRLRLWPFNKVMAVEKPIY
ncbi:signal peptidase I [Candidatus Wolfebacteria bacterium CG03_land_8_20_14_0_80_40_12]|uniref:Signal peptidase I n=1 Tax=Candidatus Wolfebacteria bacterium CG03_land_8_20_14_0_80_40_12 TaxID=1975069 RepID=A0A2M7B5M2_9BACT|nr:MAG: signal peptidase I [Candidatus Wolfebacteria bacterium CG03_land_8_20_14_0_80_40_12]